MIIGVPKEIKALEKRVGLTPSAVGLLTRLGHRVYIQKNAGKGSEYSDRDYLKNGAIIVNQARQLYRNADLIQKVKEPLPEEYPFLRPGQIVFCFLHLASQENRNLLKALQRSKVIAIGFETVVKASRLPILSPMSEIAGGLSACYSSFLVQLLRSGKRKVSRKQIIKKLSLIAAHYPEVPRRCPRYKMLIYGAGAAGKKAIEKAKKMGLGISVVERNSLRLAEIKRLGVECASSDDGNKVQKMLEAADIVLGCAHSVGQRAVKVVTLRQMKSASVIKSKVWMDIAIDQGGNFPQAKSTRYSDPIYYDSYGNIRFSVPNIPSFSGRFASEEISKAALPYVIAMARDFNQALAHFAELKSAINVKDGKVVLRTLV